MKWRPRSLRSWLVSSKCCQQKLCKPFLVFKHEFKPASASPHEENPRKNSTLTRHNLGVETGDREGVVGEKVLHLWAYLLNS